MNIYSIDLRPVSGVIPGMTIDRAIQGGMIVEFGYGPPVPVGGGSLLKIIRSMDSMAYREFAQKFQAAVVMQPNGITRFQAETGSGAPPEQSRVTEGDVLAFVSRTIRGADDPVAEAGRWITLITDEAVKSSEHGLVQGSGQGGE